MLPTIFRGETIVDPETTATRDGRATNEQRCVCAQVSDVSGAKLLVLRFAIVGLVRKAKAPLFHVNDVLPRVLGIWTHDDAEQPGCPGALERGKLANQSGLVLDVRDGVELSLSTLADQIGACTMVLEAALRSAARSCTRRCLHPR